MLAVLIGTRWLSKWSKELDLLVKTLYYGLTVGHGALSSMARIRCG